MDTIRAAAYAGSIAAMALLLSACATAKPPEAARALTAHGTSRPATHIYVTEGSLDTACYQEVGEVSYVEPFATAVTDPEHLGMADELRKAAIQKYPNRVDAIINVHTEDHDIGSEVLVSGEAVQLEAPSKIDCKLPDTIAAALVNFATGFRSPGALRGATSGPGFNGPAGTTNTASDTEGRVGADTGRDIKDNLRRTMVATMPGQAQTNESSLVDQAQLRQAEIARLRTELDRMISQRCETVDVSAAQCDSMRKSAELKQPHEMIAIANKGVDGKSPSVFEMRNMIQAQDELIARLRGQIADLNEPLPQAAATRPSN